MGRQESNSWEAGARALVGAGRPGHARCTTSPLPSARELPVLMMGRRTFGHCDLTLPARARDP